MRRVSSKACWRGTPSKFSLRIKALRCVNLGKEHGAGQLGGRTIVLYRLRAAAHISRMSSQTIYAAEPAKGWLPWGALVPFLGIAFVAMTVVSLTAVLEQRNARTGWRRTARRHEMDFPDEYTWRPKSRQHSRQLTPSRRYCAAFALIGQATHRQLAFFCFTQDRWVFAGGINS